MMRATAWAVAVAIGLTTLSSPVDDGIVKLHQLDHDAQVARSI